MATAITADDVAALEKLLVTGELEIEYESGGERRRVKFSNAADLKSRLDYAKKALAEASGLGEGMTTYAVFTRG